MTPSLAPAGALTALEAGTVKLFQGSTRSVVNVVDLTVLSGKAMKSGTLVPEVGRRGRGKNEETRAGCCRYSIGWLCIHFPRFFALSLCTRPPNSGTLFFFLFFF